MQGLAVPQILLASAETSITLFLKRILTDAGFSVSTVRNAENAIAEILDPEKEFSLLVLSSQRSPIFGRRVLAAIRERECQVPVILASGNFVKGDDVPDGDPRFIFLSKPFLPDELVQVAKRLLESR
jgi:DNA-binding NtrC family response regulator